MKTHLPIAAAVAALCLLVVARAADFTDDFSSNASLDNWTTNSGNLDIAVDQGVLSIDNTDPDYLAVMKHDDSRTNYTMSVDVRTDSDPYQSLGIIASYREDAQGFSGYMFTVSSHQMFAVTVWNRNRSTTVQRTWNSHVHRGWNRLLISKKDRVVTFVINGILVYTMTEDVETTGGIGLSVGNDQRAEFDNISVSDSYDPGTTLQYFSDDFASQDLDGWAVDPSLSTNTVSDGICTVDANSPTYPSMLYVDGDFSGGSVSVRMRHVAGDTLQFYGILLMENERSFDGTNSSIGRLQTMYLIDAAREYATGSSDSEGRVSFLPRKNNAVHGAGEWDTLEVTADFGLRINGIDITLVDEISTFNYNAVGVWVGNGVIVEVDDFAAGDKENPVVHRGGREIRQIVPAQPFVPGAVFTLTGRLVGATRGAAMSRSTQAAGTTIIRNRTGRFSRAVLTLP